MTKTAEEKGTFDILISLVKQITTEKKTLHEVALPTFVLEPRSMLERITDFMSHPELLTDAAAHPDPVQRFVLVVRYFLSGWHIRPSSVKKPYNPVLGEIFRCKCDYKDGKEGFPDHGILIQGDIQPKSDINLRMQVVTRMKGASQIVFTKWNNERYDITMPNLYTRGLLSRKLVLDLGDTCVVQCKENDLTCTLKFSSKDSVEGKIKRASTNECLYDISGKWSETIFIRDTQTAKSKPVAFFDASSPIHTMTVRDHAEQEELESQRLWGKLTQAIKTDDMNAAMHAKTHVEEKQRQVRKDRELKGEQWEPRFFEPNVTDRYQFKPFEQLLELMSKNKTEDAKAVLSSSIYTSNASSLHEDVTTQNGKLVSKAVTTTTAATTPSPTTHLVIA